MEVLDSYPSSRVRDFKLTSPTLQEEALLCASINSMFGNNVETMPLYWREH